MTTRSYRLLAALLPVAGIAAFAQPGLAANPEQCRVVRMSDPGWTDITSTNAVFGNVLAGLGYEQQVESVAVSITFQALKNGDIDVFLGNWMPSQTDFIEPLTAEGEIEVVRPNLQDIRFTLAVPVHVSEAGVTDFADLADHAEEFGSTIYGIEPGAPANRHIQRMIDTGDFGLGEWTLTESSEQGMLSQVARAERRDEWVVFLAWEPHPMNMKHDITYLSGGDEYFGPNYGSATVNTVTRTGYVQECPNIGKLLEQLQFTVDMENEIMAMILDEGMEPMAAAATWLEQHPEAIEPWLEGVTTIDDAEGLPAVQAHLGLG